MDKESLALDIQQQAMLDVKKETEALAIEIMKRNNDTDLHYLNPTLTRQTIKTLKGEANIDRWISYLTYHKWYY